MKAELAKKKKNKEGLPVLHTMPQSIAKGCVHSPGEWTTEPTNEQPEKRIKCHLHQVITASWQPHNGALVMMVLGKVDEVVLDQRPAFHQQHRIERSHGRLTKYMLRASGESFDLFVFYTQKFH
jgi:hypothetical protein